MRRTASTISRETPELTPPVKPLKEFVDQSVPKLQLSIQDHQQCFRLFPYPEHYNSPADRWSISLRRLVRKGLMGGSECGHYIATDFRLSHED